MFTYVLNKIISFKCKEILRKLGKGSDSMSSRGWIGVEYEDRNFQPLLIKFESGSC